MIEALFDSTGNPIGVRGQGTVVPPLPVLGVLSAVHMSSAGHMTAPVCSLSGSRGGSVSFETVPGDDGVSYLSILVSRKVPAARGAVVTRAVVNAMSFFGGSVSSARSLRTPGATAVVDHLLSCGANPAVGLPVWVTSSSPEFVLHESKDVASKFRSGLTKLAKELGTDMACLLSGGGAIAATTRAWSETIAGGDTAVVQAAAAIWQRERTVVDFPVSVATRGQCKIVGIARGQFFLLFIVPATGGEKVVEAAKSGDFAEGPLLQKLLGEDTGPPVVSQLPKSLSKLSSVKVADILGLLVIQDGPTSRHFFWSPDASQREALTRFFEVSREMTSTVATQVDAKLQVSCFPPSFLSFRFSSFGHVFGNGVARRNDIASIILRPSSSLVTAGAPETFFEMTLISWSMRG